MLILAVREGIVNSVVTKKSGNFNIVTEIGYMELGNKIGVVIKIIGAISIKHPRTNKIPFKRRAITYGLSDTPRINFAAKSGTCNVVKQ